VPTSRPVTCPASGVTAPVSGRVCQTRIRLAPAVEERIVQYDEPGRTLIYEAVRPPGFLTSARSSWHVEAIDGHRCRVSVRATVQVRGVTGWVMYLVLQLQLARTARQFLLDLEHYVLHGRPSPRKQRELDRRARHPRSADRS
jgi:Polyketide cyclase / dehydrase and lipid transport